MIIKMKIGPTPTEFLEILKEMAHKDPDNARWIAVKLLDHNRKHRGQPIPMSLEEMTRFITALGRVEPLAFEVT